MEYRAIGLMSGSSLDGLDVAFVVFRETGGKWSYEIEVAECLPYDAEWLQKLKGATELSAKEYLILHSAYGKYTGQQVLHFIEKHNLQHRVQIIASHGHTTFHEPAMGMTAQLGDGAAIAAVSGINTISDLRAMDVALGGQGAPIVPLGEKLLFSGYPLLLNLGGIANLSAALPTGYIAYDICPANRVLNMLANEKGAEYDQDGQIARSGFVRDEALAELNRLSYYSEPYPKSLANDFGTEIVYPLLKKRNLGTSDAMRTMTEHIVIQITRNTGRLLSKLSSESNTQPKMLVTGGGALNTFLMERLANSLKPLGVEMVVPDLQTIQYKEALIMALLGVLRWREENTVLHTVTGSSRSSIGGAVWIGQDA
ncbi:MAG: anhydro-N-acetylmuramic acid kinase [Chitinophagaceae bacterium]|jgi:anhydro-N-acetylmuramic acid kinase|nr:anhydro-N-acetylmuramic acid kinase [Chitinophagaceae bacterium]